MAHSFSYLELHSTAPTEAVEFYRRLFGWTTTSSDTPMGPYTEIDTGDGLEGGAMKAMGPASHWVVYVRVDDLREATGRARELGGKVMVEHAAVPDVGHFSLVQDPTGATFGLFQRLEAARA